MSMRRHILLAEQFRLMCLLLENREAAIYGRFGPLIAALVSDKWKLAQSDFGF